MFINGIEQILIYIDQGGAVIWCIMLACLLLWTLILERYLFIKLIFPKVICHQIQQCQARSERKSWYAHRIREAFLSQSASQLSAYVSTIKTLIVICPLLGLLGTVTGMINVFEVIAFQGTSNAQAMASGIFRATIPTMTGLVIALSGLYFNNHINQLVESNNHLLAEKLNPDLNSDP